MRTLYRTKSAVLIGSVEACVASGAAIRIAIPIAGDDAAAKKVVAELVDISGFDAVDAGTLTESWCFQPGTPAYCTELATDELRIALAAVMKAIASGKAELTRHGLASNNRAVSA